MHIPSRVEVLSWNENQVADLLREHKLLDCVDCIFQRHIDGQKLLNLKEGDVMYFLEIQDQRSRGKFWNIIKKITEKKGGVQNLMNKFQAVPEWNNNAVNNQAEFSGDSDDDDSFDDSDNYDEPEDGNEDMIKQSAISRERQETIKKNLMGLFKPSPQVSDHEDELSSYPASEDIYDVPEDGCGEPDEDMYDVPSDESGGGIVKRHGPLERQESDQYLIPDDTKLKQLSDTIDEEDYEDLGGAPPPMGSQDYDSQEDYVVPDTRTAAIVPPRPPKPSSGFHDKPMTHKAPPVENGHKKPVEKMNSVQRLQAKFQEPEKQNSARQPPRVPHKKVEKKPPDIPNEEQENYVAPEPPKPVGKKPAVKPPVVEENYEPPVQPPPLTKRPIKRAPVEPEQDTYEPPDQPPRHPPRKPPHKPPTEIEQENYEAPETPIRLPKKTPPVAQELVQETYEPPTEPQRKSKPEVATLDPEENYEAPDTLVPTRGDENELDQEDYEVPDTSEVKEVPVAKESPKKSPFKIRSIVHRSPKKNHVPPKDEKRKAPRAESPRTSAQTSSPAVPENRQPPSRQPPLPAGKNFFGKLRGEKTDDKRSSMALPSLPTDNVDSKTKSSKGSESPNLPPKPKRATETPAPKEKPLPSPSPRHKPEPPTSKPPSKSKEQLLQQQPWFHGSISKTSVADKLKSTKKDGAYLVRNSSRDPGKFIMSIFYKNDIRHLNMPCENGHYRLGDSGTERFRNIEELVTYFNKHDVEFSAGGKTPLTHACMK